MAEAGLHRRTEGRNELAVLQLMRGDRLPGEHHPLPRDGRVEAERSFAEGMARLDLGAFKTDLELPTVIGGREVELKFGAKSIDEVKVKLVTLGLALKDSPPGFDPGAAVYFNDEDDDDDLGYVEDEQL